MDATTKTTNLILAARRIGGEHRQAFVEEFGHEPVRDEVGDWDVTGWVECWRTLGHEGDYDAAREAYLSALFGD